MSGDYRCLIVDATAGVPLAEAPLDGLTFSRVLTGVGALSGQLDNDHPACTEYNLGASSGNSDREITVVRDDIAVWNGPITGWESSKSSGAVSITAREASWYLQKRTLEVDKIYTSQDLFDIVRDLITYMTTKTSTVGDGMGSAGLSINAALPRWSVSSATAGVNKSYVFFGAPRYLISVILEHLYADPQTGFEFRMDYTTGSSRQSCHRTLTLGYPSLGTTHTELLTEHVLTDYGRTLDWEPSATRVHGHGQGYTKTLQNTGSVTSGTLLLEGVADRTDSADHNVIDDFTREFRRLAQPVVQTFIAAFTPGLALPYGIFDLGDTVTLAITTPDILSIANGSRRIVQIDTTPASGDAPETVALTFNLPLDQLGA